MSSAVTVLTPTGHRRTVKVQPNTTLLKVLEEVCAKANFDPNEYELKHHKRIVDLTSVYRFSGLPNNCLLEMVEATKKRQITDVELVIQLSDGTRVDGKFNPNVKLSEIIEQLCPHEKTGEDLFAIYMRIEVPADKLSETSLKDLGLLGGRAIIRLVHRDPNAAKIQANVALNLQPKPSEVTSTKSEDEVPKKNDNIRKPIDTTHSSIVKILKEKQAAKIEPSSVEESPQPSTSSAISSEQKQDEFPIAEPQTFVEPEPMIVEDEPEEDIGEVHILGERNAVLFTLDAANSAKTADLPDTFFDLNVNDIKLLIKDLRSQAHGTVDQPLLTAKLREMEEEQNQLSKLNRYKTVIIRVQFPNRYVLQGTFTPYETIEKVMDFVRSYLIDDNIEFHLYTTPPKNILSKELRLFEAGCVPTAVLHFGCDQKQTNYLREDIMEKVSSPKASLKQAANDRGLEQTLNASYDDGSNDTKSAKINEQRKNVSNSFKTSTSSSSVVTGDAKLPKWFKPIGK